MNLPSPAQTVSVAYEALGGVDLSTQARYVSPHRSPAMDNMCKRYADGFTDFLETRPGMRTLFSGKGRLHGLYALGETMLVHAGAALYTLDGTAIGTLADADSRGVVYEGKLYLLDGTDYYVCDGQTLHTVEGTVPTTTVGRSPAGGGTLYQPVNLLTDKRCNSFRADGVSTLYTLDTTNIASVVSVTVDGKAVTNYSLDKTKGTVTFATAPPAPGGGDDNVRITFTANCDRSVISKAISPCVFDNRLFVANGGRLWHSRLDDPAYFADTDWYRISEGRITALAMGEGCLYALHSHGVTRHTPSIDYDLGRVYAPVELTAAMGAVGPAAAFLDDIVWRSAQGVEGLAGGVSHRSTLIDIALSEGKDDDMAVWNGYLCLLHNGTLYLADGRAPYRADGHREYEWFPWSVALHRIWSFNGLLYGAKDDRLVVFDAEDDDGQGIESYFETRAECAGEPSVRKRVNKKGAMALLKKIANADVTVEAMADEGAARVLDTYHLGGWDFGKLDFATVSFTTAEQDLVRLPLRIKDFLSLRLRFRSTKRFGVAAVRYRAQIIDYTK